MPLKKNLKMLLVKKQKSLILLKRNTKVLPHSFYHKTPYLEDRIEPGKYFLSLEKPNYATINAKLDLSAGEEFTNYYTLDRSKVWKDSVAAFKKKKRRIKYGIISGLAAGCEESLLST